MNIDIPTPRWAVPLLAPSRYKGAKGGRGSGKSYFFAERLVECCVADPDLSVVCIREIQKSLKFSAKRLIESTIRKLGVQHLFEVQNNEIRRAGGSGVIIFQGMQDHTADSIKSLEGFGLAWCEESQALSARSLELLLPTIREQGSEIWFSWNPDQEDDPVDDLLVANFDPADMIVVHVNFPDNPFCPPVLVEEARRHLKRDPITYAHVWEGAYNTKSDDQVMSGKWIVDDFEVQPEWNGPYLGADWGFSSDPNTLIECWVEGNTLLITREQYGHGIEIDDTPDFFAPIETAKNNTVRADSARPELISYMKRNGYPRITSVDKWPGSVEDGISKLRSFDEIVIHERCKHTIEEARLWKYKRDRLTRDVLPVLIDKNNHCWDAIRYAIAPLVKRDNMSELLDMVNGR